jgi:hypothetical protein
MAKKLYIHNLSHWSTEFAVALQDRGWRLQSDTRGAEYSTKGVTITFKAKCPAPIKVRVNGHDEIFMIPSEGGLLYISALEFWEIVFGKREGDWVEKAYASLTHKS